jgi:hypothetical protein
VQFLDVGSSLALAAVMLANGMRKVPAGATVFRRIGIGPWRVARPAADTARLDFVSWWSPFSLSVLVDATPPESRQRVQERPVPVWLRIAMIVVGTKVQLLLVFVLPAAVKFAGVKGLVFSLAALLALGVTQVVLRTAVLRRSGVPVSRALRRSAGFASPFNAPRAYEQTIEDTYRGADALTTARALLTRADFDAHVRARAYDRLVRGKRDPELDAVCSTIDLERIVSLPKDDADPLHVRCPRCAASYRAEVSVCADCDLALSGPAQTATAIGAPGVASGVSSAGADDGASTGPRF